MTTTGVMMGNPPPHQPHPATVPGVPNMGLRGGRGVQEAVNMTQQIMPIKPGSADRHLLSPFSAKSKAVHIGPSSWARQYSQGTAATRGGSLRKL